MLQRHKLEVRELHHRPHHPVLAQGIKISALNLLLRVTALHNRHAVQEDKQVRTSEHGLVDTDTREDFEVRGGRDADLLLQEAEPERCCGSEDEAAVCCHAGCTVESVVVPAPLLDGLLGHCVAGCEKDGCGDGLGEDWARGQLGLVPVREGIVLELCAARRVNG